ncbi:hypothetical protein B0H13DRAFT_2458296 [Mycena leptocephala]|nr:hypothetical protein B0H13DRAFT_2458296 [Mycena leptocephala]
MRFVCWSRSCLYCGGTTLRERYANVDAAVVDVEVAGHSSSMRRVHTQRVRTLGGRVRAGKETSLSSPLTSMCARERRICTATIGVVMIRRPCFPPPSESALAFLPHNFLYLNYNKSKLPRFIGHLSPLNAMNKDLAPSSKADSRLPDLLPELEHIIEIAALSHHPQSHTASLAGQELPDHIHFKSVTTIILLAYLGQPGLRFQFFTRETVTITSRSTASLSSFNRLDSLLAGFQDQL